MRTTIKATCDDCGDVELRPARVRLVVCSCPDWSYYAFTCPCCERQVEHPADPEIVALLLSGGVPPERWHIPAEALEPHAGEPISHDDVLDFALGLGLGSIDIAASALR